MAALDGAGDPSAKEAKVGNISVRGMRAPGVLRAHPWIVCMGVDRSPAIGVAVAVAGVSRDGSCIATVAI